LPDAHKATLGLRERKKAKTRAAIQRHALRLFGEQGYAETTVEQIAAAAEVSPSTFFRYFPTKEAVVFNDECDAPVLAAFAAQPPDVGPVDAIRNAMLAVAEQLSDEEREHERDRVRLMLAVPELRAAMMTESTDWLLIMAKLVGERAGRDPEEFEVRAFAGAMIGVVMAAMLAWEHEPASDYFQLIDRAFSFLRDGLPL
jgi:AcrR family transcriptional regulator